MMLFMSCYCYEDANFYEVNLSEVAYIELCKESEYKVHLKNGQVFRAETMPYSDSGYWKDAVYKVYGRNE